MSIKKSKKFQILQTKNIHLTKKIKHLEDHHLTLASHYGQKIAEKHVNTEEANDSIKRLEQIENALLDRLKNTHSR